MEAYLMKSDMDTLYKLTLILTKTTNNTTTISQQCHNMEQYITN